MKKVLQTNFTCNCKTKLVLTVALVKPRNVTRRLFSKSAAAGVPCGVLTGSITRVGSTTTTAVYYKERG